MVTLRIRVMDMSAANARNLLQHFGVFQNDLAQIRPVLSLSGGNDVIDGRKGVALMIQVAVLHGLRAGRAGSCVKRNYTLFADKNADAP